MSAGHLERVARRTSLGITFSRFQQTVGGIPVLGGDVVVTDAPGRRGDLVIDHRKPALGAPPRPQITGTEAIRVAENAARVEGLRAPPRAELAILPVGGEGTLVWRVLVPSARPLGSFEILVDAQTRGVVRIRDLLRFASGTAALFDPNPVERLEPEPVSPTRTTPTAPYSTL